METITATVHGFDSERTEVCAKMGDQLVTIDPFITNAITWPDRHKLRGELIFEGRWYSQNQFCFIAESIYSRQSGELTKIFPYNPL